jgi:hypothetical protein
MPTSRPLFRKIACALMGLALFLVAGGHLALLQTVAWTTMVHDFSRTGSLTEAVSKTFDGEHLCPMCKKIAAARAAEEKAPASVKAEKKSEVFLAQTSSSLPFPVSSPMVFKPAPFVVMPERVDAPPVPVPRALVS